MTAAKQAKGMKQFHDYWRLWSKHGAGDQSGIFDSRESIGVGHYKLWKYLTVERRYWRRYLHRLYGFSVRTGQFTPAKRSGIGPPAIPILEEPPAKGEQTHQDILNLWSHRRQCLRHPFYQALEQYLVVCECLEECGDPPQLLANPAFTQYPERRLALTIKGVQHVRSVLLREMKPTDFLPGETWGDYMKRPHKHFRCRDMKASFRNIYMPITKILDIDFGPDGDTDQFFGSFADTGISLTKDVRLKAALKLGGADPYENKQQLLPPVVMNKVIPQLLEIADPLEREAAFRKLPGKAAYALGQVMGVVPKKSTPLPAVEAREDATSNESSLYERVAPEQISEQLSPRRSEFQADQSTIIRQRLAKLSASQKEVYILHELDGMTLKEIAQHLDIALGTAASHYSRAKAKIKEMQK